MKIGIANILTDFICPPLRLCVCVCVCVCIIETIISTVSILMLSLQNHQDYKDVGTFLEVRIRLPTQRTGSVLGLGRVPVLQSS